jgi:SAM-dependent methyltransferase
MSSDLPATLAASGTEAPPNTPGRFGFGANWARYLREISEPKIEAATADLAALLGMPSLEGRRLLDIGSGSGIHSLAATRLGATVTSFDFDDDSVGCTMALRERFAGDAAARWTVVGQGSVLDAAFVAALGHFDIVYSWGVLHHTGAMRRAIDAAASCVAPTGMLVIALYNDQGMISAYWTAVKRLYNASTMGRVAMTVAHLPYLGARFAVRALTGKGSLERGMSLWHDYIDWLGGYPFEVAAPTAVEQWLRPAGFSLRSVRSVGRRQGCNEFVFARTDVR